MRFLKPALSLTQQLQKWQSRGLLVADSASALHYLQFIGYYRLSAYTLPYQDGGQPDKPFMPGTTFEDVLGLYVFDRELRLLVMDAIERIEVAVRSGLMNHMCIHHGPHWFMDNKHFKPLVVKPWQRTPSGFDHNKFLNRIDKELGIPAQGNFPAQPHNEVFINHYYTKYTNPYLPPAWMVFELLPMGTLSMVFANLQDIADRKAVAKPLGVDETLLVTWLHSLSYVRNLCAHHSRLWNRQLVIKPTIGKRHIKFVARNDQFYAVAVILWDLLRKVAPHSHWHRRLSDLFRQFDTIPGKAMGFPPNWRAEAFWDLNHFDFEI